MTSRDFDHTHGTDTGGEIPVEMLDHDADTAAQAVSYEASDPGAFRVMARELPIERSEYTFIDLGSGKGRVVLLAAQQGFGRVVGIEASASLHDTARLNLRAWARAGNDARHVRLLHADAAALELPPEPLVLYLFNPFRERTMSRVLLNLRTSLQRSPRDVWFVYYNPQLDHMLERAPCLARVTVGRGFQQGDYAIWRSHGEYRG